MQLNLEAKMLRSLVAVAGKSAVVIAMIMMTTSVKAEQLPGIVVFQSDFGLKDGAVSAMQGVAMGVSTDLKLFDLTHEVPAFNIWEASYRLKQTMPYWPAGTVFVSVIDPGVGTERKSVVLKTKSGHYVVTPDNGTLSLVVETLGLDAVRRIDEEINRRKDSTRSYTFHGRDVYAFTGARLASNTISFEEVGKLLPQEVVSIPYQIAKYEEGTFRGNIPILDPQYGNVWTNIPATLFEENDITHGTEFIVDIRKDGKRIYKGSMPYVTTFGDVPTGKPLIYINSLLDVSLALNMSNFASEFGIFSGPGWSVSLKKAED